MPYAINDGIRIHYAVVGDGPPLVLQHGFSGSGRDWHEFGYVEAMREHYRLILIDARGHGDSDKPYDHDAYALRHRVADIVTVLDDLNIAAAHYLGYSMGGWIGYGMAEHAPDRLVALLIGGAQPYGRSFEGGRKLLAEGSDAWAEFFNAWGYPCSPDMLTRLRRNDSVALIAALQDRPDISHILPSMHMPCLLFGGDADPEISAIRRCAGELPNGTFLSLPGLNHLQVYQRGGLATAHVLKFLASV